MLGKPHHQSVAADVPPSGTLLPRNFQAVPGPGQSLGNLLGTC